MYQYSDLLKNRRSIRNFTDQKIDPNIVHEILQETCMAPSASNGQPWEFIVIHDQDLIKRLSDESKKNLLEMQKDDKNFKYKNWLSDPNFNVFYHAPCLVLMISNKSNRHIYYDLGLAAAYFMFAATARGLGTCWIGLGDALKDPKLLAEIGLPADFDKIVPLILGYPKAIPGIVARKNPIILSEK